MNFKKVLVSCFLCVFFMSFTCFAFPPPKQGPNKNGDMSQLLNRTARIIFTYHMCGFSPALLNSFTDQVDAELKERHGVSGSILQVNLNEVTPKYVELTESGKGNCRATARSIKSYCDKANFESYILDFWGGSAELMHSVNVIFLVDEKSGEKSPYIVDFPRDLCEGNMNVTFRPFDDYFKSYSFDDGHPVFAAWHNVFDRAGNFVTSEDIAAFNKAKGIDCTHDFSKYTLHYSKGMSALVSRKRLQRCLSNVCGFENVEDAPPILVRYIFEKMNERK